MPPKKPRCTSSKATLLSKNRVLFVNAKAGPTEAATEKLAQDFASFTVQSVAPGDLRDAVRAAVDARAEVIAVAGGDGTLSSAAQELRDSNVPLLVVPEGTRNHFAHDLGVHDVALAAVAAVQGQTEKVDVGDVNGRVFINNASLGTYCRLVRTREKYERRFRKRVANLIAAWNELRHGHHITVALDGETQRVWAVFVGNGAYGEGLRDVTKRESLQEGRLDVWVVRAGGRWSRLRVTGAVLFGRLDKSPMIVRSSATDLCVESRRHQIDVACDGEVQRMDSPLNFSVVRGGLAVLVPNEEQH